MPCLPPEACGRMPANMQGNRPTHSSKSRRRLSDPAAISEGNAAVAGPSVGRVMAVAAILAAATLVAFRPVLSANFISWDDAQYLHFQWAPTGDVADKPDSPMLDAVGLAEFWKPYSP